MIAIEIISRGNAAEEVQRKRDEDGSYLRVTDVYDCALIGV